jgi:hypothetical protein
MGGPTIYVVTSRVGHHVMCTSRFERALSTNRRSGPVRHPRAARWRIIYGPGRIRAGRVGP